MAWNNVKDIVDWIGNINDPDNYRTNLYFLIDAVNKIGKYEDIHIKNLNEITSNNPSEIWEYLGVAYQEEYDEIKTNFFKYKNSDDKIITINVDSNLLQQINLPKNLEYKEKIKLIEPSSENWHQAFERCVYNKEICGTIKQQETKCTLIKGNQKCPIKCVGRLAYAIANKKDNDMLHPYIFNTTTYRRKFPKDLLEEGMYKIECEEYIKLNSTPKSKILNRENKMINQPLNQILYGSPGTGKTYNTINKALEIIFQDKLTKDDYKNEKVKEERLEKLSQNELSEEEKRDIADDSRKLLKACFEKYKNSGQIEFVTFHQSYGYEEFVEGIKAETKDGNINYEVKPGIFKKLCEKAEEKATENYILIIDEINRGNISKIFGELITLIEPSKRIDETEEIKVKLPYSNKLFGVPQNLYIIGTMNTADRSIAQIDTALRRRFHFEEMMPKPELLKDETDKDLEVDEIINIKSLLEAINERIEYIYDREHQIGHSYFLPLKVNPTKEKLDEIFRVNIIPLLAEYFYGDWADIKFVLNDTDHNFITIKEEKDLIFDMSESKKRKNRIYNVSKIEFSDEAYQNIYALKK